jgi:hypothetical protein
MDATTIDDQLAGLRRRIGWLQAIAEIDAPVGRSRIHRHLDALRDEEASLLAAAPDEFEAKLAQLKARVAVAENAVFADLADDWETFAAAVEREARSWDTYLEQLQAGVFPRSWKAREQAEEQVADVRMRLVHAHASAGDGWQEQRELLAAARDQLEVSAAELSTRLDRTADRAAA